MAPTSREHSLRIKTTFAVLLLFSAFSVAWLLKAISHNFSDAASLPVRVAGLSLVGAAVAVFLRPRLGYLLGMVSGAVGLYWFAPIELSEFPALNSWIIFNLSDRSPPLAQATPRIVFVGAIITSTVACLIGLLPAHWRLRRRPIRERIWPAFAISLVVVAAWYFVSASPYRIPIIADGPSPELAILHVQKDGLQLHEAEFRVYLGREFYFSRNDRRLIQYEFSLRGGHGVLTESLASRVEALAKSPLIPNRQAPLPKPLRAWHAEGWYVRTRNGMSAFTTENTTEPPKELVELFRDFFASAPQEIPVPSVRDVCLGFCYDPPAALGMECINQRCRLNNGTRCE